jgi:hypothetical protein
MFKKLRPQGGNVLLSASLLVFLFLGCSSGEPPKPTGTVSGTVSLNGKPYNNAAVVFFSLQSGQAASANIGEDGSYRILNPLWVGTYQVYLAPTLEDNLETAEAKPVYMDETIPEKYYNETTTDIICSLSEGENTFAVELKK